MADSTEKSEMIQVGDWVLVPLGGTPLEGQVIEDYGYLGGKEDRVLRVLVPWEEGVEPRTYPIAERRLTRVS
jgi:hypothetical protein